jgi:hypothetical protein
MALVVFKKICPKCGSQKIRRLERKPWMRYLSKSKYYRCNECRTGMLVLYDRLTWKVS